MPQNNKTIKRSKRVKILEALSEGDFSGYITGMDRSKEWVDSLSAHIYKGTYDEPTHGMCKRSVDKDGHFSIFRNNVGRKGICKTCLKNVIKELTPLIL